MERSKSMVNMPLGPFPSFPRHLALLPACRASPECPLSFLPHLSQVYQNISYHAELCFLSWFKANKLSPGEHYHVTWFLSWSPCARCAEETANFLKQHRNVTLRIFTARLYYFWNPAFQQGLRKLHCLGAQVKVMSYDGESRGSWDRAVGGTECPRESGECNLGN